MLGSKSSQRRDRMPVITISRQFGAGGLTLGKMVAKKLNYALFDQEIIQMVAEKAKVSSDWVRSVEKESGGKFQKFVSGLVAKSLVDRILDDERGYIDETIYVDMLQVVIKRIADEGDAVIVGRGGQYILRAEKGVVHVLFVADLQDRIRFISDNYKLTRKQAAAVVSSEDKRRMNLYRKFGKEDYDHPGLYHMVVNTSRVDMEKACSMVCRLVSS